MSAMMLDQIRLTRGAVQQVPLVHGDPAAEPVLGNVLFGHFHGLFVDVHRVDGLGPKKSRRHGQDAAAGAHIEHFTVRCHQIFQPLDAHAGGGVGAGAEGHSRIQGDDLLVPWGS